MKRPSQITAALALTTMVALTSPVLAQGRALTKGELEEFKKKQPETFKQRTKEAKEFGDGTVGKKTYAFCIRRGLAQGYRQPALGRWCTMHGYNN